jgi:Chitobiase/beta-hexosaminidase C-terminal domain
VSFASVTSGVTFYYTTDGVTDPTEASQLYSGSLNVAHTTKFRIRAFKPGYAPSAVKASNITMNFGTLIAPTITPAGGAYTGTVSVVMSSPQSFATIQYTTGNPNNTTPSSSSTVYSGPVPVNITTTVRAKAFHPDYVTSAEATPVSYTVTTHTPVLSTAAGSYAPGSTVTISAGVPTDVLRMTIDGTDPTTTSPTIASGTTLILGNFTLKVKAWRTGAADSAIQCGVHPDRTTRPRLRRHRRDAQRDRDTGRARVGVGQES